MKAVILVGGGGSRLWPMSRREMPKQFFSILSDEPLVKDTFNRLCNNFSVDDIYFSTTKQLEPTLREMFTEVPAENFIVEPEKRDTGPAMGYVAAIMELESPDEPIAFVPSDHYIADVEKYANCFRVAEGLIKETGKMIDIGIDPEFPSTVLGYTGIGGKHTEQSGVSVYQFAGHAEKPDVETAKQYIDSGEYLWHGNYYMWTPRKFMQAYCQYAPELGKNLRQIQEAHSKGDQDKINKHYSQLERISIDYAITEKMDPTEVLIIKGDFGWSDVGAWDVLHDQMSTGNEDKNTINAKGLLIDTENTLVYGPKKKLIAAVGLKDMVVVDTDDALLICPMEKAQEVKKIIQKIKESDLDEYL